MKNNDDILATDTTEIKQLINRVKQGELDQGDAQLIEKLLSFLLTIVSLLQRKHTKFFIVAPRDRKKAGKLGVIQVRESDVLLGAPFIFNKANIDRFDF